ncbi:MAG: ferritin-like domain-containing protein [Candidatus Promineifilaceae bacterium]
MNLENLHSVYVEQLKDMYSAEKQLVDALPKMAAATNDPSLQKAFQHHLEQTRQHMTTVQTILEEMDENPGNKKCVAMEGLVEEGNHVIKTKGDRQAKDAALILAAQKVEHYEIASYGGLRAYANNLGYSDVADRIQEILDEEYEADQKLDNIAMGTILGEGINEQAEA